MLHTPIANLALQLICAKVAHVSSTGTCYIGFSSTAPSRNGSGFTEPSPSVYPSYERIQVAVTEALEYTDKWGTVANGTVTNAAEFNTPECLEEGGWPAFTHFGLFAEKTGGVPMVSDVIRDPDGEVDAETGLKPEKPLTVAHKQVGVFRKGALTLTLN